MNVELLLRLKDQVLKEPGQFDMRWWHQDDVGRELPTTKPCGTIHCFAGWIQMMVNKEGEAFEVAREALDITMHQASELFYLLHWPSPFKERYRAFESTLPLRAEVAAARIDDFIKWGSKDVEERGENEH